MSARLNPGRARVAYILTHRWMRKRLNAGCTLPTRPPVNAGPEWFAARDVVIGSGRQPSPFFDHALHYDMTYVRRARVGRSAS